MVRNFLSRQGEDMGPSLSLSLRLLKSIKFGGFQAFYKNFGHEFAEGVTKFAAYTIMPNHAIGPVDAIL